MCANTVKIPGLQSEISLTGAPCTSNSIREVDLSSAVFVDLNRLDGEKDIAVKRMRPLYVPSDFSFFAINGHADFHKGQSENPKIGTV